MEEAMRYNTRKIRHVEAMLEFLKTFAHYERFEQIREELIEIAEKGGEVRMCNLVDQWIDMGVKQGLAEGIALGQADGRYISLQNIIKNGISEAEGIRLLNFSKEETEGYHSWLSGEGEKQLHTV
ncbi:MAG: hypothetical protein Q4C63_03445 [Eubacteriales bacterium]|nr:hypothetical protein [Eubacteriales bacterium]